jgi:bacillithiol system protein YtxJ
MAGGAPAALMRRVAAAARYNREVTVFRPLATRAELDALLEASHAAPIILFKHSRTCGFSHMARTSLEHGDLPDVAHEIVVQERREIADAVATVLGVRHQSPQVIVVAGGVAVWHASHAGVTARRIADAFRQAADRITPASVR